jgi:hypothetical protein
MIWVTSFFFAGGGEEAVFWSAQDKPAAKCRGTKPANRRTIHRTLRIGLNLKEEMPFSARHQSSSKAEIHASISFGGS